MRFPWTREESELDQEIRHHLHHLAAEYERQGYSREEALRMAKREFGGSDQVKENCRDESRWAWLIGLRQDISFGLRIMRRTPMVTVAAILSLALGIGANTAIVSLMDTVLWRELPVPEPKQLAFLNWSAAGYPREMMRASSGSMYDQPGGGALADFFSYPAYQAIKTNMAGKAALAAFNYPRQVSVSHRGRAAVAQLRPVSGNFFTLLGVQPQSGRMFTDADDRAGVAATAVVTHRFWQRDLGADPAAVGQTIVVNNKPCTVTGVLRPNFFGLVPTDETDIYMPMVQALQLTRSGEWQERLTDPRAWGMQLVTRLAPGVDAAAVQPAMQAAFASTWTTLPKDTKLIPQLQLIDGRSGLGSLRREFRSPLFVLGGLVTLLLLIACVNIANLLLARASARQKEVAMRVSLGCSRARLMRQFFTESAILALLGGIAGVIVAYLSANVLAQFVGGRDSAARIDVVIDARLLGLVLGVTVVTLLLFGLFPAWRGSRLSDASWLKQGSGSLGPSSRQKWNAGRILLLGQVALSVVLVMTAVVFSRNLLTVQSKDPGFDRRNMVMFDIRPGTSGYTPETVPALYANIERRLAETPGVAHAGIATSRPMNVGGSWRPAGLTDGDKTYQASINWITPSYLPLYTRGMVAGRNFTQSDMTADSRAVIISEDFARKLGGLDLVGRKIVFSRDRPDPTQPQYEIVGIAPTFAPTSIKEQRYAVWHPFNPKTSTATIVLRTSASPEAVLPAIRQAVAEIDRNLPMVEVITMEQQISKILQRERMFATLCSGFGILALVLTVIGLYGVMAYSTSRRRSEIGVRLALGAVPNNVLTMVLREGLLLAVLGIAIGVPFVWMGAKYVEKELYEMKPLEPLSFAFALGIMLVAAVVAVGLPALRASRLQPIQTLRQE